MRAVVERERNNRWLLIMLIIQVQNGQFSWLMASIHMQIHHAFFAQGGWIQVPMVPSLAPGDPGPEGWIHRMVQRLLEGEVSVLQLFASLLGGARVGITGSPARSRGKQCQGHEKLVEKEGFVRWFISVK